MNPFSASKRFLRQPALILSEIGAIALAGTLGALWPEKHVFQSPAFALVTLLTAASLAVVVTEQFRRLRRQWKTPLTAGHFKSAPFQAEFERPATTTEARQEIWTERRLGLAGSLVFHTGLLSLIVAGAWRALFVSQGAVDLVEGETLAPQTAWASQWPGVLGDALRLPQPLTLQAVTGSRYADGSLRELRATLSAGEIAINRQLDLAGRRIYLLQKFGPAALLEWNADTHQAVLLANDGHQNYTAESVSPHGARAYLYSNAERPSGFELRVMRGDVLLAAGTLGVGQTLALPNGEQLALRGAPMWARLQGSRDSALWLAGLGMILSMTGAAMMFCLVTLDFCVVIQPQGAREKVFVALKPQRFAPLFQERFDALVRSHRDLALHGGSEKHDAQNVGCARIGRAACGMFLLSCLVSTGCHRVSRTEAKQLVERYNQVVSEAYRRADVRLLDSVVGPNEGKKLTGLIGVRLDFGITLDSHLLALDVTGVEQDGRQLRVCTQERWSYRDLKIGSGEQVGDASLDSYAMIYCFTNLNRTWLVDEIKFAAPPQVGRTNTPWIADRHDLPGAQVTEAGR